MIMDQLTRRQNQIVSALISYGSAENVAQALSLSPGTVRNTLLDARKRADVNSNFALVHLWTKHEMVRGLESLEI